MVEKRPRDRDRDRDRDRERKRRRSHSRDRDRKRERREREREKRERDPDYEEKVRVKLEPMDGKFVNFSYVVKYMYSVYETDLLYLIQPIHLSRTNGLCEELIQVE